MHTGRRPRVFDHLPGPGDEIDEAAFQLIGAAIEVHKVLGPGYLEAVYEEALCHELTFRSIPFQRQVPFSIAYKDKEIGEGRLDLLVMPDIVVELKAVEQLNPVHAAQVISYLKATRHRLGILINFNVPVLKDGIKRIIL